MSFMVAFFAMQCGATIHYLLMMVGVEARGAAIGSMQFVDVWAGFIAPPAIGFILQATNSYAIPFVILGGGISVAGILISTIHERDPCRLIKSGLTPLTVLANSLQVGGAL